MPPKRAAKRNEPVARSSEGPGSYFPGALNAEAANPLPDVATMQSWGYGSSTASPLPRQMQAQPEMRLAQMAESIETGVKGVRDRDQATQEDSGNANERGRRNSRSATQSASVNASPVRRGRKREPTPDEAQLHGALREATANAEEEDDDDDGRSTATPTPPIPHALTTASSPVPPPPYPNLPSHEPLYPSPFHRFGSPPRPGTPLGDQESDRFENESLISWGVERDIHEDDLQRTRPARYREKGKTITQPPRRFSGLAFANETIQEEDEPESVMSVEKSPTPQPAPAPTPRNQRKNQPSPPSEPQPQPRPQPQPQSQPEPKSEPEPEPEPQREPSTAPTRTIIPRPLREPSFHDPTPPLSESVGSRVKSGIQAIPKASFSFPQSQGSRIVSILLLAALSVFTAYSFSDTLAAIPREISSCFPLSRPSPYIPFNATGMEAINSLSKHVARIDTRVSSLSGELNLVRMEVENIPPPTTVIESAPARTAVPTPKVNFLTRGMGVVIDPHKTSPTVGSPGFWKRLSERTIGIIPGFGPFQEQPPLMALERWEDVGDCWCSAPNSGVSQLSVKLGRSIVPEEVVVEHIPKGASIDSNAAPKEMELWAHFVAISEDSSADDSSSWLSSFLSLSSSTKKQKPSSQQDSLISGDKFSLHENVMSIIRSAYRDEPEPSFSGDKKIGPDFYRVGRWMYDIDGTNHVQEFTLDAIIDEPAIRVDHVVVRVKSNWGAGSTCLYRVKLHGHT